jgi:hypothetical protein
MILEKMNFVDPIVIDPQSLAQRVLSDLEAAVDVSAKRRGEEETDQECEANRSDCPKKSLTMWGPSHRD